jgi:alpha-1,3-glucan synthase
VFIQNIFLSAPYGRNWAYLFGSKHCPGWATFLLVLLFFVVLWAIILWYFSRLSETHSWFVPLFAVGLGAPRWCQIWWATSGIGSYLPWAGSSLASAVLGRCLWLWLGLLDTIQNVGIGMLLLQTMVRSHVTWFASSSFLPWCEYADGSQGTGRRSGHWLYWHHHRSSRWTQQRRTWSDFPIHCKRP